MVFSAPELEDNGQNLEDFKNVVVTYILGQCLSMVLSFFFLFKLKYPQNKRNTKSMHKNSKTHNPAIQRFIGAYMLLLFFKDIRYAF